MWFHVAHYVQPPHPRPSDLADLQLSDSTTRIRLQPAYHTHPVVLYNPYMYMISDESIASLNKVKPL